VSVAHLARALLDEPRWVETRSMLLAEDAAVTGLTGDHRTFVARALSRPLVAVVGHPEALFLADAVAQAGADVTVLCADEYGARAERALPGWRRIGAQILAWPGGVPLPAAPPATEARLLEPDEVAALGHLPRALHRDLLAASADSLVAGAFSGGAPVSFCHAAALTETLWDIAVTTLDGYRRRGLATRAVQCLMAEMREDGWWPVWGAEDDNPASLAFARRLGFTDSGRLALFRKE